MKSQRSILFVLALLSLGGCISHLRPLQEGGDGLIAGRETAGLKDEDAQRKALILAARLTVDHGFRYFMILPATPAPAAGSGPVRTPTIHAGQPVRVRILRGTAKERASPGVWDAYRLLTRQG